MKTRGVLMLVAAALLAAAGLVTLMSISRGGEVATSSARSTSIAVTPDATTSPGTTTPATSSPPPAGSTEMQAPPPQEAPHLSDAQLQAYLDEADPSTVPEPQRSELVALAAAVLSADLTGQGRENWPAYFDGQPPSRIWTGLHVRAAVAKWGKGSELVVEVTLVWTGTDSFGVEHLDVATTITMVQLESGWMPKAG